MKNKNLKRRSSTPVGPSVTADSCIANGNPITHPIESNFQSGVAVLFLIGGGRLPQGYGFGGGVTNHRWAYRIPRSPRLRFHRPMFKIGTRSSQNASSGEGRSHISTTRPLLPQNSGLTSTAWADVYKKASGYTVFILHWA